MTHHGKTLAHHRHLRYPAHKAAHSIGKILACKLLADLALYIAFRSQTACVQYAALQIVIGFLAFLQHVIGLCKFYRFVIKLSLQLIAGVNDFAVGIGETGDFIAVRLCAAALALQFLPQRLFDLRTTATCHLLRFHACSTLFVNFSLCLLHALLPAFRSGCFDFGVNGLRCLACSHVPNIMRLQESFFRSRFKPQHRAKLAKLQRCKLVVVTEPAIYRHVAFSR